MAVTALQRDVCRLLAADRRARGESYAGGVALGMALGTPRYSRDLDLFHDTDAAVASSWDHDRRLLEQAGYQVDASRERPGFVEATVSIDSHELLVEWARDSAFRFFPLVEDDVLGLALHPFDLATNKVLALVGRLEVRDWIDVIACDERLQPLGYLAWAACGQGSRLYACGHPAAGEALGPVHGGGGVVAGVRGEHAIGGGALPAMARGLELGRGRSGSASGRACRLRCHHSERRAIQGTGIGLRCSIRGERTDISHGPHRWRVA